jgi:uncharacterized protein YbbC (DUF1343 family)
MEDLFVPCVPRLNHCRIAVGSSIMAAILLAAAVARGATPVRTGAHVLHDSGYRLLAGKRVGLITNQTGRVGDAHLIDLLQREKTVRLTALFAPEHGLRGEAEDGVAIREGRDTRTGVPVHSLYGAAKKPSPAMLRAIDLLLFDIQDIGVRFYTYIATLGLAMQAAAEAGIPLVVLDRPNPLGGEYVAGFVLEPAFASFTGLYPIPVAHGLTVGELARLIKGERLLPGLERLDLQVVPMSGWHREMCWPATGLPWVATSPNIPDFSTPCSTPASAFLRGPRSAKGEVPQRRSSWWALRACLLPGWPPGCRPRGCQESSSLPPNSPLGASPAGAAPPSTATGHCPVCGCRWPIRRL